MYLRSISSRLSSIMNLPLLSHLQGIFAFAHSVETGSFTAAADRMGVSKSATGKSVARLEERLGVRLLDRTTRSLSLTAEGKDYYESCRKVLDELGTAEAMLASRKRTVSGTLRINLPISFGHLCVMPVLLDVASHNPDLGLEVTFTDRVVDLVEEGIDLSVRIGHSGDETSIMGRRLCAHRAVICAAPDYLDRHGRPTRVEELANHDCLAFARHQRPGSWETVGPGGKTCSLDIRPRYTISHGEALAEATVKGLGIAYLATWVAADYIRSGALEVLPIPTPAENAVITALWPRGYDLAPKVRVVVSALVEAFTPLPPWERGMPQVVPGA